MIFLVDKGLSDEALLQLARYQQSVDAKPSYAEKVIEAKERFEAVNRKGNKTFDEVKQQLSAMCCGAERCHYCEDSRAAEVEHIKPKSWFPELCFEWLNYCYACGPCNRKKGSAYAAFLNQDVSYTEFTRQKGASVEPAPNAVEALINPRAEHPLELIFLDLANGQFTFTPRQAFGTRAYAKAKYTIATLGLNTQSHLVKARRSAYNDFLSRLTYYIKWRDSGDSALRLAEIITNLKEQGHQTVWQEMKRQHRAIPELNQLFLQAPEALTW